MKITITEKGVFDADGKELAIGSELEIDADEMPASFVNKARVLDGEKVFVTNPALKGPFTVGEGVGGWYPVLDADGAKVKNLRKADAEAFPTLSDEDQAAFLAE